MKYVKKDNEKKLKAWCKLLKMSKAEGNKMLAEQRRRKILEKLEQDGAVKTSDLSSEFSVSEITIRNDLDKLQERGALERTHGGAVKKESTTFEPTHEEKALVNVKEKKDIGKRAAEFVNANTTIFLSTGTTTMQIIPHLEDKNNLRVITNSLNNGYKLTKVDGIDISIIGGDFRQKSFALVGPTTKEYFENIYLDQLFLGVNGVSISHGITTPTVSEAKICRAMIDVSEEVIVVADHSKFGKVAHGRIASIELIDKIITDKETPVEYCKGMEEKDVDFIKA